jgi:hypothetical protein
VTRRAAILLRYSSGENIASLSRWPGMTRLSVSKWIVQALAMGPLAALKDKYHRPKEPVIGDDAKAWVVHVACSKPKDLGYAAEVWSRQHWPSMFASMPLQQAFPPCPARLRRRYTESWQHNRCIRKRSSITRSGAIRTSRAVMREVLIVYQDVELQNAKSAAGQAASTIITVSVDEKPGIQAIGNTAPDLPPVPGKHSQIGRDGHVTARVEDRHRAVEFIGLLSDLDRYYPPEGTIHLTLDNHSAHICRETNAFLAQHPNRFQYVLTRKHGSWLDIVETLFGKMARTFLRHIRVQSLAELKTRI